VFATGYARLRLFYSCDFLPISATILMAQSGETVSRLDATAVAEPAVPTALRTSCILETGSADLVDDERT
jgi:hypothetical protein